MNVLQNGTSIFFLNASTTEISVNGICSFYNAESKCQASPTQL